jgi:hypothetical protein
VLYVPSSSATSSEVASMLLLSLSIISRYSGLGLKSCFLGTGERKKSPLRVRTSFTCAFLKIPVVPLFGLTLLFQESDHLTFPTGKDNTFVRFPIWTVNAFETIALIENIFSHFLQVAIWPL